MRLTSASFLVFIVGLVSPGVLLTRHIGRPTTEQNREEIEFSGFTSYYHRSGSADKAPKMLQYFISNKLKSKAQSFAESELTLQALRNLSTRSASKRFEDISDPKKIALRCAQETEKASAYISELAIKDRTQKELQSRDYVSLMWRIDFVKPDRYHVIQKFWGGGADYFYDEWVTLGSEHYDNAGFWMKSDRTGRSKLNPRFRADKYLTILRTEEPKSAAVYHHLGRRYYLLEYESAGLGDFASFSESLIGPAHFRIWIDSETGLLAKGELAARNKEPAGKETPFELEQAFAGYGLDIQITTPQVNAAQEHSLKTIDEVSDFMQSYYEEPRPDLIEGLIVALHSSGYLQKLNRAPGVIGFFSEIFAANPDRRSQWQAVIAKQDDQVKAALGRAFSVSTTGGIINLEGHSAELNDEYWGAFFASGNPKFIAKLVDQLRYFDERNDEMLFFAGATAKWSLSSNALNQPGVRSAIEQAKLKADKRTQEIITELLAKDPSSVKQEMIEIIKVQRESGKWR